MTNPHSNLMRAARSLLCVVALGICFGGGAAANAQDVASQSTVGAEDSPDAAMRRFLRALKDGDRAGFLSCLSRTRPLRWLNYMAVGPEPSLITYHEIAKDFREKTGLYYSFLVREDDGDVKRAYDCFADHVGGEMWKKRGAATFYPPDEAELHNTGPYVRWKKEGRKWVIAEIAYNTA
jgi:hypothetical protein